MNAWFWLLLGVLAGAPVWIAVSLWSSRRIWITAKKLQARARGHEHLVELGQLVGGLAHEIKNPLSTINVNLNLLAEDLERYRDDEHARLLRRLGSVQAEVDRVRGILEDVLRFAGKYELDLRVTDLRDVIQNLSDFFAPQAEAARVVLRTPSVKDPVNVRADANLLKQALLNLLINAVQAMSQSAVNPGGELLVRLSAQRGEAVIEVIDTGPGIPPETLGRIFEVYYSTKKGGSGLGLPTTRRIIREHEGTIRAESEVGKGTRFIIRLPLAKP